MDFSPIYFLKLLNCVYSRDVDYKCKHWREKKLNTFCCKVKFPFILSPFALSSWSSTRKKGNTVLRRERSHSCFGISGSIFRRNKTFSNENLLHVCCVKLMYFYYSKLGITRLLDHFLSFKSNKVEICKRKKRELDIELSFGRFTVF